MKTGIKKLVCKRRDTYCVIILAFICIIPYVSITFLFPSNWSDSEPQVQTPWKTFGVEQSHVFICAEGDKLTSSKLIDCSIRSSHSQKFEHSVDIVISHYEHSLVGTFRSILAAISQSARPLRIFVYSKGYFSLIEKNEIENILNGTDDVEVYFHLKMKNVGRCDHTYLYHIGQHYNDLASFTIFLKDTTSWHVHLDEMSNTLSLLTFRVPSMLQVWCPREMVIEKTSFQLKKYKSEQCSRFGNCYQNESYVRAMIRPLGKWMAAMNVVSSSSNHSSVFGLSEAQRLRGWKVRVVPVCYGGVFAASSNAIRHSSIQTYGMLEKELSVGNSLEAGHYMERAWLSAFGVWAFGTMEHRNRLAVVVVGDMSHKTCAKTVPVRFEDAPLLVSFFFVNQHLQNRNTSDLSSSGWRELVANREEAIYAPHRIKEIASFDYSMVFFNAEDDHHPSLLSTVNKAGFSICSLTDADIRIGIGRSLVNGASVALPLHKGETHKYDLGVVLRRMTDAAEGFGEQWLEATSRKGPQEALVFLENSPHLAPLIVEGGVVTTYGHNAFWYKVL